MKTVIVFSLMLIVQFAFADTIILNKQHFKESFSKEVKISGSVRTGVMYESSLKSSNPDILYININGQANSILCVKLISIDGRYEAGFEYTLDKQISGLTRFEVPTRFAEIISSYPPDQIAILAEIKKSCKDKSISIVPASWGMPETNKMKVFLNSGVSTTLLKLYLLDGGKKKIKCHEIKSSRNTAYDTECVIDNYNKYNLLKTKVIRKNFDNFIKPIRLSIKTAQ